MIHLPEKVHKDLVLCFLFEQDSAMQIEVPGSAFNTPRFFPARTLLRRWQPTELESLCAAVRDRIWCNEVPKHRN